MSHSADRQRCFREPIPQILDCARYLDAAVAAHIAGRAKLAEELFSVANNFGKMHYTLEELGLADPRLSTPECSSWNGLDRFLAARI